MMKNKLIQTTKLVKSILEKDKRARNSDNYLYYKIIEYVAIKNGVDINTISLPTFLLEMSAFGFPPFETVRRTRQKVQENYPELQACEVVQIARADLEQDYRTYARAVVE